MNQDALFQALCFGGLYTVSFFLVYCIGRRASPSLAIRFSVGGWLTVIAFMLVTDGPGSFLVFIFLVIAALFVFRKKVDNSFQQFFSDNHIYKATVVPEQVSQLLGSHYYSCADGTLTSPSSDTIPFTWWQGMTSSMTKSGNAYVTTFTYYLAVSFAPNVVSETFKQAARAKADTSGFTFGQKFRRWFVLDTDTPIGIKETQDGSFVIIWQTYHNTERYASYLTWLKANLWSNAPVETGRFPAQTPESVRIQLPSSRQQHEQAIGQTPNLYTQRRR